MTKKAVILMAMLVASIMIGNAQTTEVALNVNQRVSFMPGVETQLLHIDLGPGEWSVNAELNLFAYGVNDTQVFYASYLSLTPTIDYQNGRTALGSQAIVASRMDTIVPLVGRRIMINTPPGTTKRVYLMVYVFPDAGISSAAAYGFAYGHRVAP